jgi:phosphotransferase system enzyme I (PtsI)
VLRLLKTILDVGRKRGVRVSMCGEMPGDDLLAFLLIGMELKEFSVTPSSILALKRVIRGVKLEDAKKVTRRALSLPTSDAVLQYARKKTRELYPELFG